MFKLAFSGQFKKDVKTLLRRNYDMELLKHILIQLENTGSLDSSFKPHHLSGKYSGYWEAHIKSDWLIIWKSVGNEVQLVRTGTHSDLF